MATNFAEVIGPAAPLPEEVIDLERLPEHHQESLEHTQRLAAAVGTELPVHTIEADFGIPQTPGAYLFSDQLTITRGGQVLAAMFNLDPKILSGKIDSAHAVLPGRLSFIYSKDGKIAEGHRYVAAKGYYKREVSDRFRRMNAEVQISRLQRQRGEIAFDPIAVIVAPAEHQAKSSDTPAYNLLLVTALDESVRTLDNQPWQLGFDQGNLELADSAVDALGEFNATVGKHGDAKVKNVAQIPNGKTGMIDFETSEIINLEDSSSVAAAVYEDLAKLFASLGDQGFYDREPYRAREVLEHLGERYIEHWNGHSPMIQDVVYETVISVVDDSLTHIPQPSYSAAT